VCKKYFSRIELQFVKNELMKVGFNPGCLEFTSRQKVIVCSSDRFPRNLDKSFTLLELEESSKVRIEMKINARIDGLVCELIVN
jgi:hypothetical protein